MEKAEDATVSRDKCDTKSLLATLQIMLLQCRLAAQRKTH